MCVSWKSFVLLLLHAGLHGLAAAHRCQLQGQCLGGNLLKEYLTDSLESCITQGGQVEGTKFVTWKSTQVCQAFSYCQSVDVEAEAVTSFLECKVRGITGECVGQIYAVPGEADCKQLCEETPTCASSSYLEEQQYCLSFADCTSLTTTNCSTSISSYLEETSTTPSTTTPIKSPTTSAPAAMNKILYFSGIKKKTTLVSLDGTTANCELEDYPASNAYPGAVTYNNGEVLACGGYKLVDSDRCWRFDGFAWSSLPNSNQKHCNFDSPNVFINDGWWVFSRPKEGYASCSVSTVSSEVFTGAAWIPGPALPEYKFHDSTCVVNLNTTHTLLIGGGYPTRRDTWLYDWSSQAWTKTGSLIQARYQHGCVSLGDLGILVVGGRDEKAVYTAELYNPVQGTWSSQPDLPRDIDPYGPLLLNWDDQVLALFENEDQIYHRSEETGEWSVLDGGRLPDRFQGDYWHKAVLVPGNWSC